MVSHIPDKGQVLQRYYGWYANRTRGIRRRTATHGQASASAVEVEPVPPGLLVRTYQTLRETDLGFSTERILRMAIFTDQRDVTSAEELPAFYNRLSEKLSAQPGVESVGLAAPTVPPGFATDVRMFSGDLPDDSRQDGIGVQVHAVDKQFFETLGIPIVHGRAIEDRDQAWAVHVVVVSESVAELLGGPERAVGRSIELGEASFAIVGIAADVLFFGPLRRRDRDLDVYTSPASWGRRHVMIRRTRQ